MIPSDARGITLLLLSLSLTGCQRFFLEADLFPSSASPTINGPINPEGHQLVESGFVCMAEEGEGQRWFHPWVPSADVTLKMRFLEARYHQEGHAWPAVKFLVRYSKGEAATGISVSHFFFTTIAAGYRQDESGEFIPPPYSLGGFALGEPLTLTISTGEDEILWIRANDSDWVVMALTGEPVAIEVSCQSALVEMLGFEVGPATGPSGTGK